MIWLSRLVPNKAFMRRRGRRRARLLSCQTLRLPSPAKTIYFRGVIPFNTTMMSLCYRVFYALLCYIMLHLYCSLHAVCIPCQESRMCMSATHLLPSWPPCTTSRESTTALVKRCPSLYRIRLSWKALKETSQKTCRSHINEYRGYDDATKNRGEFLHLFVQ